jgi:hypothetical protein
LQLADTNEDTKGIINRIVTTTNVNNFAQCAVCLSIYSFSLPFLVSLLLVRFKKRVMLVKRVIRSRKSEKNKRHNGKNKKKEKTNNDPQNTREAT